MMSFIFIVYLVGSRGHLEPHTLTYHTVALCQAERQVYITWGFHTTKCHAYEVINKYTKPDTA